MNRRAPFCLADCLLVLLVAGCLAPQGRSGGPVPSPAVGPTATAVASPPLARPTAATPLPSVSAARPTQVAPPSPVAAPGAGRTRSPASGSAAAGFDPQRIQLELERAWAGLSKPLGLVHAGDDSGRVFVLEQGGLIKVVDRGQLLSRPFLDLTGQVSPMGTGYSERGLLGVAFHPRFGANGLFFVNYTDRRGDTQVVRYRVSPADRNLADPASATIILSQPQPYANHNGGHLAFGPDGYLYIGLGDGGSANDPQGNSQNLATWLGKLLRIDVDVDVDGGEPYAIPTDNPFRARAGARPEVWAYGLRNPWRYSFDRATGDLYIADVGQNAWEEIDVQPAGSGGGQNYGWNLMEGAHCRPGVACDPSGLTLPVAEYGRSAGCSVTGGYVYRGSAQPGLAGAYLYGDYCSGRVWALARGTDGSWRSTELLHAPNVQVSSFGEDQAGEVYLTSLGEGVVYRLVAREH